MGSFAIPETFERVLVALLVGFLIGLDRERAEARKKRRSFAGVRTFPLIALVGELSVELLGITGPLLAVASFAAVAAVALVSYRRSAAAGAPGATTEMAALATFLLGAMAGKGELLVASALGIGVAVLLVAKPRLEGFSRALSQDELSAALELAVISGIILPLLPNRGFGPWEVWNPFDIWLVVVLVSAVSFAGFVAMRIFGEQRGLALAGLIGGMVSSTAVTAAMAERAREAPRVDRAAAAATVLASVVMSVRVALFAGAFGRGILPRLLPVTAAMGLVGLVAALWLQRDSSAHPGSRDTSIANPSSLFAAVSFAVLYAVILLVVRAAREYLGTAGMYAAAALSAVADVDAVTIAFASGGPVFDAWRTPAAAVSLALVTNTLFKLGLAVALGTPRFRRAVAAALSCMAMAGAAVAVFIFLSF